MWAALAAARPLGVLSVLLGWSPGLGASLLLVISAGVFARVVSEEGLDAVRAGSLGVSQCCVHGGSREGRELALFSCPAERSEVWDHPSAANTVYEELGSRDPHWN